MADKNEKWSVNSGKWAYSKGSPGEAGPAAAAGRRRPMLIAALVALAGVGLAASLWLGLVRLPGSPLDMLPPAVRSFIGFGAPPDTQPAAPPATVPPSPDTSRLEAENTQLKRQLEEKQKTIDEKQQIIDRQAQEHPAAQGPAMPAEYSIIRTAGVARNLQEAVVYADHQFVAGQEHWVRASCYFSPVVNGVKYWIDLARREQPDFAPKIRLASPETLDRAGVTWPDVFYLASKCPWMDSASFTPDQLSSLALLERPEPSPPEPSPPEVTPVPPMPPPDPVPPQPERSTRRVFQARDMVGSDITKLAGIGQTECEALCVNDRSCQGYTYDNWNRLCITKASVGSLRIEPRSTTVVFSANTPSASNIAPTMTMRRGRAFRDSAYNFALASGYEACANLCLQDDKCLGVNFNQTSNQCQFFASPSEYEPSSGITLGYKSQPSY